MKKPVIEWTKVVLKEDPDDENLLILDCEMPEDGEEVILTMKNGDVVTDICGTENGVYALEENAWVDVAGWVPMPEAMKEGEENEN